MAIGSSGTIYEDDYANDRHARLVRSALTEVADALGDVDGYAARFSDTEQANPAIAANIAERLLVAGRAPEALAVLVKADPDTGQGRSWPDWERVRIDVLEKLGRSSDAQTERWAIFERDLNADYLRAYLKRLPDFDDEEAEFRAIKHVRQYVGFHQALQFLINWPAYDAAADLILERHSELDGDHYWLLTPAADGLDQRAVGVVGQHHDVGRFQRRPAADLEARRDALHDGALARADSGLGALRVVVGIKIDSADKALPDRAVHLGTLNINVAMYFPGQNGLAVLLHRAADAL